MLAKNNDLGRRYELLRKVTNQREERLTSARRKLAEEIVKSTAKRDDCLMRKATLLEYAASSFQQLCSGFANQSSHHGQSLRLLFDFAGASFIVSSQLEREVVQLDRDMISLTNKAQQLQAQLVKCARQSEIINQRQLALRRERIAAKRALEELGSEELCSFKTPRHWSAKFTEVQHD